MADATPEEQAKAYASYRRLLTFEQMATDATEHVRIQLAQNDRDELALKGNVYAERKVRIMKRFAPVIEELEKDYDKLDAAFLKDVGRDTDPVYPIKEAGRISVGIQQLDVLPVTAGGDLFAGWVKTAEGNDNDMNVRALIQNTLPILEAQFASAKPSADRPLDDPDPIPAILDRARVILADPQTRMGQAARKLSTTLRMQVSDVIDTLRRTGQVEDRTQGIGIGGEVIERPRRPDLTPVQAPSLAKLRGDGVDVILTPKMAANDKVMKDAESLARLQGGTVIISDPTKKP